MEVRKHNAIADMPLLSPHAHKIKKSLMLTGMGTENGYEHDMTGD